MADITFKGIIGVVEAAKDDNVVGWAFDTEQQEPVSLTVLIDDIEVGSVCCQETREDVNEKFGRENTGFSYLIPDRYRDGLSHKIELKSTRLASLSLMGHNGTNHNKWIFKLDKEYLVGQVDTWGGYDIHCWAIVVDRTTERTRPCEQVIVQQDGDIITTLVPVVSRPDVADRFGCNVVCGFVLYAQEIRRLSSKANLHFFFSPNGSELIGSPVDLSRFLAEASTSDCNGGLSINTHPSGLRPALDVPDSSKFRSNPEYIADPGTSLDTSPSAPASPIVIQETVTTIDGRVDEITSGFIRGWAINRQKPHVSVSLDIFVDNHFTARCDARLFRKDLHEAGLAEGKCAFMVAPPVQLLDGRRHVVNVRATNTVIELDNSPATITLPNSTPLHLLAQLHQELLDTIQAAEQRASSFGATSARLKEAEKVVSFYQAWNALYVQLSPPDRERILREIALMDRHPVISVLMPTYNTDPGMLRAAIESVRGQMYPHWELCVADDKSDRAETVNVLKAYESLDPRIKIIYRPHNGHISEATNTALSMAEGLYIALLDHDDELTPDALFRVAQTIKDTNAPLIYSDEDKIDTGSTTFEPHLKPAFNYTLLLSYNYICHLLIVRRELALSVGGFRTATNGSQDYDFILRVCEIVDHDSIVHIPHVLYHWRVHKLSTALTEEAKGYVVDAATTALNDHLVKVGTPGKVVPEKGTYRVIWPLPANVPLVSIIIPTRDCADVLSLCMTGLLHRTNYPHLEIIIIDNGSREHATKMLFAELIVDQRVNIVSYDQEFNYSAICNFGVSHASGSALLMLNNDVEVNVGGDEWLAKMVSQLGRPEVGAVGTRLLFPNGELQHAGVIVGLGGVAGHAHKYLSKEGSGYFHRARIAQEFSACTAACLLIRTELFNAIGGFDEHNLPVAFNDVDLCLRIREAGWNIVYEPSTNLTHHESYSRGAENTPAKIFRAQREVAYMKRRWDAVLLNDPAYSPSLTLDREDFGMDLHRGSPSRTIHRTRALPSCN